MTDETDLLYEIWLTESEWDRQCSKWTHMDGIKVPKLRNGSIRCEWRIIINKLMFKHSGFTSVLGMLTLKRK